MAIRRELPVTVGRVSPSTSSKRAGRQSSREARARLLRIRFLTEIARQIGAQRIALGHTRDDQAESFLLRLIRGSGARGLAGIYPVVDGLLIRPLIEVRRHDIVAYLKTKRLRYHIDESNRDITLSRNRVRWRLLPLLERQFNPAIVEILAQTADLLRDEDGYLDVVAREEYGRIELKQRTTVALDVTALQALPLAIRRRVLRLALTSARGDLRRITQPHVERSLELLESPNGRGSVSLPEGCLVSREGPVLRVLRSAPGEPGTDRRFEGPGIGPALCPVPGEVPLAGLGLRLRARVVARHRLSSSLKSGGRDRAFLDADLMPGPLLIRGRRPGDRFVPMGGPGTRKVKSFLIDRKVNVDDRERIPLVLSGDRIAWVVGYAIDERFKVTPTTRRILVLEKEPR
jgi:tRNA(Ile)-lysidine synthase